MKRLFTSIKYLLIILLFAGCSMVGAEQNNPEYEAHFVVEPANTGKQNSGIELTGYTNGDFVGADHDVALPWDGFRQPAFIGDTFQLNLEDEDGETFVNMYIVINQRKMDVYGVSNASQSKTDVTLSFTFTEQHAAVLSSARYYY